ncbi:nuclear transport factor 2 family protein [Dactylosporangium sp. AC04546]|uniref:nuclear transport factor 2 family protein n=1 Tax=Dactylosporangium sp. AC04546 TaxID=2862460 RepID=UPI001EE0A615|nr:nuclear transport factor 2 family protein [Dactylosporangium sp. AC04546]WVK80288.1 nuclear transport factor 2 family protein [Dactylosporangium sp. AC04546]
MEAAQLASWLDRLTFSDCTDARVTRLVITAVEDWGRSLGWRVYPRAASVVPLPPPYEQRRSVVDVGFARADGSPVVVEIDHADRRRTLDKLAAEAAAGRLALWVRWGSGRFATPPDGVHLVALRATSRTPLGGGERLWSRTPEADRPAPEHSDATPAAWTATALDQGRDRPDRPAPAHSDAPAGAWTEALLDPEPAADADVELVLRAYAAFAAGDIAGAVRDLHPDVEWIEPDEFPNGGRHVGPAAVARYLQASYDDWLELHSEPSATRRGDRIVVVHHVHGVVQDLSIRDVTVADVFTVADGRVVRMQAYADPATAA